MDDLLKQLTGQGGAPGQGGPSGEGAGDLLGAVGGLLGGGGLASVLGGAVGGGIGAKTGGGLGGLVGGGLGAMLPALLPSLLGMLGGRTPKGQSGVHQLVDGMHAKGLGGVVDSWVGTGENESISPADVKKALGPSRLKKLSAESGLPTEQVSEGLAALLPGLVNHLTPDGRVPSIEQVQARIGGLLR